MILLKHLENDESKLARKMKGPNKKSIMNNVTRKVHKDDRDCTLHKKNEGN